MGHGQPRHELVRDYIERVNGNYDEESKCTVDNFAQLFLKLPCYCSVLSRNSLAPLDKSLQIVDHVSFD